MAEGAVQYAKELGCPNPEIVLHLDHGDSFELANHAFDMGFSSVMIDGSHLPYDENVALTKKVVDYAHQFDVTVEGELGVLAGVEDEVSAEHHTYTNPEEVIDFVTRLRLILWLFLSVLLTVHTSSNRNSATKILLQVVGSSSFGIRRTGCSYGETYLDSQSFFTDHLQFLRKKLIQSTNMVASLKLLSVFLKINCVKLQSLLFAKSTSTLTSRLAMTAAIRKVFAEKPAEFDPRKYLGPARDNMEKLYKHKIINVLGSNDKL
jgi:fructose-bisphosphate aldolase class II